MEQLAEIHLPNGAIIGLRLAETPGGAAEKVDARPKFEFDSVAKSVAGVAQALEAALASSRPAKATVSFGVEVTTKSGKLLAALVEGEGKATLNVTLEWSPREQR